MDISRTFKTILAGAFVAIAFVLGAFIGIVLRILPWLVLLGICLWIATCNGAFVVGT